MSMETVLSSNPISERITRCTTWSNFSPGSSGSGGIYSSSIWNEELGFKEQYQSVGLGFKVTSARMEYLGC